MLRGESKTMAAWRNPSTLVAWRNLNTNAAWGIQYNIFFKIPNTMTAWRNPIPWLLGIASIQLLCVCGVNIFTKMADLSERFTWVKDLYILYSENLYLLQKTRNG